MQWTVGFLDEETKAALDALPLDIRASFQRIVELIQAHGLERVREPYLKHLEGPLWEMRLKGRSGNRPGGIRNGDRYAHCRCACLCQEDAEDSRKEIVQALKRAKEVQ